MMDADGPLSDAIHAHDLLAMTAHARNAPLGRLTDVLFDDRAEGVGVPHRKLPERHPAIHRRGASVGPRSGAWPPAPRPRPR